MIDRCQALWCEKYLLKRADPGRPAGRGAVPDRRRHEDGEARRVRELHGDRVLPAVSVPEHALLLFRGVDAKGAIRQHPTALQEAYEAGKALVVHLTCVKAPPRGGA